jgi:hypothetical protein
MSHITSISLDPESAALAQRMKREGKNFSKFVRECLHIYYRESSDNEHVGATETWDDCEPFCIPNRKHFCRVCWPVGTPSIDTLKKARGHVAQLRQIALDGRFDESRLIPELAESQGQGRWLIQNPPEVLEWLKAQAEDENRFIMPLADLELEGNAKPVKVEKPRKGLLKRILSEMGR